VRSTTKTFVGLASLGVLVASAKFGLPAVAVAATPVTNTASDTATETPTPTPTPTTDSTTTSKKTTTAKSSTTTTKKTTSSSSSSTSTSTSTSTGTTASATSKTSSNVSYQFGDVKLEVVKKGGKITDVNCITCTATKGRSAAFPTLISSAISANGSGFGNLGGATYTTNAFKQALDNALGKF